MCTSKSRIDYLLTSTVLDCYITDTSVIHFPFSDHNAIVLKVVLKASLTGSGIWKMNAYTIQMITFRESLEKLWPSWVYESNDFDNVLISRGNLLKLKLNNIQLK